MVAETSEYKDYEDILSCDMSLFYNSGRDTHNNRTNGKYSKNSTFCDNDEKIENIERTYKIPFLLFKRIVKDAFDINHVKKYIGEIYCPILILHSENSPFEKSCSRILFDSAKKCIKKAVFLFEFMDEQFVQIFNYFFFETKNTNHTELLNKMLSFCENTEHDRNERDTDADADAGNEDGTNSDSYSSSDRNRFRNRNPYLETNTNSNTNTNTNTNSNTNANTKRKSKQKSKQKQKTYMHSESYSNPDTSLHSDSSASSQNYKSDNILNKENKKQAKGKGYSTTCSIPPEFFISPEVVKNSH